ncbi:hypothetical protein ACFE04_025226 [Oxalis oulophora]
MEVRSDGGSGGGGSLLKRFNGGDNTNNNNNNKISRSRLRVWLIRVCTAILLWTVIIQLAALSDNHNPIRLNPSSSFLLQPIHLPPPPPPRNYTSNGFLKVSCNGGLNQMRAAICDMVTVARLLNLTLLLPELDKTSFWADPSNFEDIFDVKHFIDSLRDEVRIVRRLPKRFSRKHGFQPYQMPPVSWSNENYYLQQILPLFTQHKVIHFNRTDSRLANNGLPLNLQKLRCRVNFQGLKFTPQIEALGHKLVRMLQEEGPFVALHLRYEMDMLAFSGCTHGCTEAEAEELKQMRRNLWPFKVLQVDNLSGVLITLNFFRYAYPWWREKEIVSEEKRSQGLCPLTPEEALLVLQAFSFSNDTQIYIASGEIYGSNRRLAALKAAFPRMVKKETILDAAALQQFQNHSSQMAALDFMVSIASDTFIPTYDGNMAKLVEGHRRNLGFRQSILLDRKRLVGLLDMYQNGTISWDAFSNAVRRTHETRMGQPTHRKLIPDKPKEEDYFYANPQECLCDGTNCNNLLGPALSHDSTSKISGSTSLVQVSGAQLPVPYSKLVAAYHWFQTQGSGTLH